MNAAINILEQTRKLMHGATRDLSDEQWLTIPDGFDNNIAWNIGHVIVAQQGLTYRVCGQPMNIPAHYAPMYAPGTSPANWGGNQPDRSELKTLLREHCALLRADIDTEKFANFNAYTTSTGVKLATWEESVVFNNFHEGLHLGHILAMKNFL